MSLLNRFDLKNQFDRQTADDVVNFMKGLDDSDTMKAWLELTKAGVIYNCVMVQTRLSNQIEKAIMTDRNVR